MACEIHARPGRRIGFEIRSAPAQSRGRHAIPPGHAVAGSPPSAILRCAGTLADARAKSIRVPGYQALWPRRKSFPLAVAPTRADALSGASLLSPAEATGTSESD